MEGVCGQSRGKTTHRIFCRIQLVFSQWFDHRMIGETPHPHLRPQLINVNRDMAKVLRALVVIMATEILVLIIPDKIIIGTLVKGCKHKRGTIITIT